MANLARTAVAFNREWTEGRNKLILVRDVTLTLTGQGGGTNKILADTLGFLEVFQVACARKTDNSLGYVAYPSADGSFIILGLTPGDVTATVQMIVKGRIE